MATSSFSSSLVRPFASPSLSRSRRSMPSAAISFRNSPALGIAAAAAGGGRRRYKGTVAREEKLAEMIERKVAEAMEACDGEDREGSDGCRVAWDEVEEVSRAKAVLRRRSASGADPLEVFCEANPGSDECQVLYD